MGHQQPRNQAKAQRRQAIEEEGRTPSLGEIEEAEAPARNAGEVSQHSTSCRSRRVAANASLYPPAPLTMEQPLPSRARELKKETS